MGRKEINEEKQFLENLDHLLTGAETRAGEDASEEQQSALEFARKMTELRSEPSPRFKDQLRRQLLLKLVEREVAARQEVTLWARLRRAILENPTWRTATVTVAVVVIALVVLWRTGVFTQAPGPLVTAPPPSPTEDGTPRPTPTPGPQMFVEAQMTPSKDAYSPGEEIVIEFLFKNVTSGPLVLEPFPPEIAVMRPSPYDEVIRSFPAGGAAQTLAPGESVSYTLTWDQRDDLGQPVPYGYYYLRLGNLKLDWGTVSIPFIQAPRLLILPAQGAMEKTIEVNQSQTVNGITFTLQRIELTARGAAFYAFNTPPDYKLPQGPMLPPPQFMFHALAEYSLDGGSAKKTGPSGIRFLDNGMMHIWENLDPVPKTAKDLTFTITSLGDWAGPWRFVTPLDR